ncbi:MAG: exodeoxyribonuclease VII small subunit [Puniceicoccales bacterium]|jgi:exodeoxyribonuclease VII small subunit|nr:exodeoxyribonuclease VII small subunit [Puniceicoccales bacterium]
MSKNTAEQKSFDVALRELEAIVVSLERGETPLEELLEKYERGMKLHQHCQEVLRAAELRIEQLRGVNNGKPEFTPLAFPEDSTETDATARENE